MSKKIKQTQPIIPSDSSSVKKLSQPAELKGLEEYFTEEISPFLTAKTVQILLIRQILDYTILRTEDSRELNTVELPKSSQDPTREVYGLFLASKQKSVESRMFMELLRTDPKFSKDTDCYLPMNLCMKCPRCVLFGSVKPAGGKYNIKHRIEYSSAFSLAPFKDINETITFNAIDEANQKTGQALNVSHNYKPLTIFPSIIALKSVTWKEFVMVIKTILASHSYGAETRVKGDVRNEIIGIAMGYEEVITPLELTMELRLLLSGDKPITLEEIANKTFEITEKYKKLAASSSNVKVLTAMQIKSIIDTVRKIDIGPDIIGDMNIDALGFAKIAEKLGE
jgi:CRISPR type I-D-associated protein Csc2